MGTDIFVFTTLFDLALLFNNSKVCHGSIANFGAYICMKLAIQMRKGAEKNEIEQNCALDMKFPETVKNWKVY